MSPKQLGPVFFLGCLFFMGADHLWGRIGFVTLPQGGELQLIIYNSADLTLVKERREMTFKKGNNALDFSWSQTLIDPTSLIFRELKGDGNLRVKDLSFPKGAPESLVWTIEAKKGGTIPVELSYFISGLDWKANYLFLTSPDESEAECQLFITLNNQSGEDFPHAKTSLVVGKINLVEEIRALGSIGKDSREIPTPEDSFQGEAESDFDDMENEEGYALDGLAGGKGGMLKERVLRAPKKIYKEGLSEYFIYKIEGEEDVRNGWAKKLKNFSKPKISLEATYKLDPDRWGDQVRRFYRFKNSKEGGLGEEPLPDGKVMVYSRRVDGAGLNYIGETQVKYIPVDEKVDLDLGIEKELTLEKKIMDYKTADFTFNQSGGISGWNDYRTTRYEIRNRRPIPASLEIKQYIEGKWDLLNNIKIPKTIKLEKEDQRTLKGEMILKGGESIIFDLEVVQYQGENGRDK